MEPPNPETYFYDNGEKVWDWLLLAGTVVVTIPFLIGNGVVFLHRKRKYFQASGWDLILGSSVAGMIWILSAFVVNQHFRRERVKFFDNCSLWTFWLQLTLGICLWLSFMSLRLQHLFVLCTTGQQVSSFRVWCVYIPALLSPAIIFSTIGTVKNVSHHPCAVPGHCVISHTGWKLSTFLVLPPLYFSLIVILLIRHRNDSDFLLQTQHHHTKDCVMMAFVLYLLTGTTYWADREYNVESRCFLTFCVCSIVFVHFCVYAGWPVYLCLFKGEDEMDKYEERLRRQGATCLQRFSIGPHVGTGQNFLSTFEGEEAIFQAIAAEQTKKEELKAKKERLRRRVGQVRAQIVELKHRRTVAVLPRTSQSLPPIRNAEKVLPDSTQISRHLSLQLGPLSSQSGSSMN